MKYFRFSILTVALMMILAPAIVLADSHEDTIEVFKKSPVVKPFFDTAYGYAVFPTVGKGGIVVGAAYGKGRVYQAGIATGTATLAKMTIGSQLGGQAFSEIIFLEDKRAYDEFTRGSFEFDANVSVVAITAGAQAQAGSSGTTAGASAGPATGTHAGNSYRKGMALFIHAKGGLMFEAALGGQRIIFEPYQ